MRISTAILGAALSGLVFTVPVSAQTERPHATRNILDKVQPDLKFTDVSLSDAIDFIRDSTDINVIVDWKSLEAVNIDRNTLINVRLREVTLRKALQIILDEAGPGNLLTFYVQDNVLEITTQAKADTVLYTMVYPVKDLLISTPNIQLSDVTSALSGLSSSGGGSSTYGGTGSTGAQGSPQSSSNTNVFGQGSGSGNNTNTTQNQAQMGAALVKLIMDTIRPDIWKENGGTSTIRIFQGNLIVTAPISVQEAIGGPVD
jgi:hypothetical protein